MLLKPLLAVASPVVGLKAMPPAENVARNATTLAGRLSVEVIFTLATMRLSVALMSTASVLLMFTVWVAAKVSRTRPAVYSACVGLVSVRVSSLFWPMP